ncbi:putative endonuclease and reverse transcriptase-like protein [Operophtera brumata]|uniref:Putative endonuclease and reverse transcriptase-like protein n=1 Tax=Operophtera brumata TaxID=104452 RepID=A0A0L7KSJ3_OPEBR|nr:putative endonuclease and reverse transcriptase-like protein [Operophtera brumata]
MLVKRRILHQPLPNIQLEFMTALGVEISTLGHSLRLYAEYTPPSSILKTADLTRLLFAAPDSAIVAAGDWNCKHQAWNSCTSNTAENRLLRHAESNDYAVTGPDTPTHYPDNPNHSPDVIDLAVHKCLDARLQLKVLLDEMQSDHQPVLLTLERRPISVQAPTPRPKDEGRKCRHSSHKCHRGQAAVRCGEPHKPNLPDCTAGDCPRPREEPAPCANCGGAHHANLQSCPVFKKEIINKRDGTMAVNSNENNKGRRGATL